MTKKIFTLILAITIMGVLITPIMATEVLPEIIEGRTFVSAKIVAQKLNAKLEWIQESKKVVLIKENQKIEFKTGGYVINNNGETLIPLVAITDQFNLEAIYIQETKEIKLIPLIPPVAQFKLPGEAYRVGNPILVVNQSYSRGGEPIIESLWEINGDNKSIQTNDINKVIKASKDGIYNIRLKVKNSKKVWSEWTDQTMIIEPYPKPIITDFESTQLKWDQGERISFTHNAEAELGDKIVELRWVYQKDGSSEQIIREPRALFEEGTYTITLQVKGEHENWSLPATTRIHITDQVKKTELQFKMENIRHGDTLDNYENYNFQNYAPVENFTVTRGGPTLLFSNSPETVTGKGVLYADKVMGDTRILYHHRNGMQNSSKNTKLVIVVENKGNEPVTITQTKKSNGGTSEDILHLGQIVTRRYFNSNVADKIVLQANEKRYLYDTGTINWPDYESFSGIMEFHSDKIITVTVAAVGKSFQLSELESLKVLPRDGVHTRGTFPQANKHYNISIPGDQPSKIMFGQKEDGMDSWIDGYDALTGAKEQNKGNYGVLYELELTSDEKTGVLLNPRGTSFKGTYRWDDVTVALAPIYGMFKGSRESSVAGVVEKKATKKLFYTLSSGSSGPVLFNFIPESFWAEHKIEKQKL